MSPNAPRQVIIVQDSPSSSATSLASIETSTSTHSSNTSTSFASQHDAPQENLGSQTHPAQVVEGGLEFVNTGRKQGGNPRGGPPQNPNGYFRVSGPAVTVHNSGGQLTGSVTTDLGEAYANGPDHTENCRKMSQRSDNTNLCFCPAGLSP